ncbi:MAG: choice-of-anchor tandem repeat NxxGxxAF-containing protein [Myxococcota bacterium]
MIPERPRKNRPSLHAEGALPLPLRPLHTSHTRRVISHAIHVALLAVAFAIPLSASAITTPIVFVGETAPDTNGGTFAIPVAPSLNNTGEVVFYSTIAGSDVLHGIFVGDGLMTRSAALTGDAAPGTSGGVFSSIFTVAKINDNQDVAFSASISGGSTFSGLFLENAGVVTPIALSGDPAPGTSGTYFSFLSSFISLNNVGQIAAVSGISGFPPTAGLFIESAAGGSLLVESGAAVPGVPGATFTSFAKPSINDSGDVAFEAAFSAGGTNSRGIFKYASGVISIIALENEVAPGTGGGTFSTQEIDTSAIDDDGNVYFQARIVGPGPLKGLFVGDGVTLEAIVLEDDALPYPGGATANSLNNAPTTSANGNAAFAVELALPGAQTERAAYVDAGDGSGFSLSVAGGEVVPNTGGGTLLIPSAPSVNNAGAIAFSSAISGGTETQGIFVPEPNILAGLSVGLLTLLLRRDRGARRAR